MAEHDPAQHANDNAPGAGSPPGSSFGPSGSTLTPDDRYAAAAASRISASRNRPTGLIWAGAAAVLAASIALVITMNGHAAAQDSLSDARSRLTRVTETIEDIAYYRALAETDRPDTGELHVVSRELPLSRIESLARRAGLESEVAVPNSRSTQVDERRGIFRVTYPYTVEDRSLPNLLEWTRLVTEEIEAMRVGQVTLTPKRDRWELRIDFARYEQQ